MNSVPGPSGTSFRVGESSDSGRILSFLEKNWRKDHVFVANPSLMLWQHEDAGADSLNFVLAEANNSIVAILGFISFRRFDPSLPADSIALAIWKRTDEAERGTGFRMLQWLIEEKSPVAVIALGLNEGTLPIYQRLGFTNGVMGHFALFREGLTHSTITGQSITALDGLGIGLSLAREVTKISELNDSQLEQLLTSNFPPKSIAYYRERFENHPWFTYYFATLVAGHTAELLLVYRVIELEGARLLRVVDIAGDVEHLPRGARALSEIVSKHDAEYLDIVAVGLDDRKMNDAGFISRESHPNLVLPNYFDPFERRNIDVLFAYKTKDSHSGAYHFHPSDSDQDRPNR